MQAACVAAGNPERAFAVVHVAGTNGKGSVSAMVESIARATGKKTGLYTSPHLARFAERIRIDGEPLTDDDLALRLTDALTRAPDISFFETATLAAFIAFRDAKVDVAVIEVGLGGRLDATNVVEAPVAAAITRIALDHQDRLGNTLVEIAREKAGIAKKGLDLVLGPVTRDVRRAIDEVARVHGATTSLAEDDEEARSFVKTATLGLAGEHQRANACVAYVLGKRIGADASARARGIATVQWPGRMETVVETVSRAKDDGVVWLLDAAHNPDGAAALRAELGRRNDSPDRVAIVFGALADKSVAGDARHAGPSHPSPRLHHASGSRRSASREPGRTSRRRGGAQRVRRPGCRAPQGGQGGRRGGDRVYLPGR